ncbi:oligosaccharide flippase family protein [Haliangium sp.]|uniref:oligosaccharide flippase family protein n=1 Tax=Haliangium sp. TaxID=2663208 RepID=UPI003D0CC9AA
MSLARKAVRGAVWTIALSVGSRIFGVISTIAIAYFISPAIDGEVKAAWFIAFTASTATRFGFDQYVIVKQDEGSDVVFHCTVLMIVLGVVSLSLVLAFGDRFGAFLNAPGMGQYIPLAVIGVGLRRVAHVPHRVLVRDLRFRIAAVAEAISEIVYVVSALSMAYYGWGGYAIVIGNVIQAVVLLGIVSMAAGWRSWLQPCRLSWTRVRDIFRFGLPLNFNTLLYIISTSWDSLMVSYRFGVQQMGLYDKAYNLATIPTAHVGEHIGGVLLPSMAKIEPHRRVDVLLRSSAILAILLFPMAVGLGVVSGPLVAVLLPENWQGVAPFLMVLASMSIFRPLSSVMDSYLKVQDRTRLLFMAELLKSTVLFSAIFAAPTAVWASVGVGVGFAVQTVGMILVLRVTDKISPLRFIPGFLGPLAACGVMAAAVLGVRYALIATGVNNEFVLLAVEIGVGAVSYVPAAFVCAPATTRDVIGLLRKAFKRG